MSMEIAVLFNPLSLLTWHEIGIVFYVILLLFVLNFALPQETFSDSIQNPRLKTSDYIINSVIGTVGGIAGFMTTFYTISVVGEALQLDLACSSTFCGETMLVASYAMGMPLGTAYLLRNNPFVRNRPKGSFKLTLKASLIGVQMGLAALLIASNISEDTKYWTAMVILPWPIISGIVGYNKSAAKIPLQGQLFLDPCEQKIVCKILNFDLR